MSNWQQHQADNAAFHTAMRHCSDSYQDKRKVACCAICGLPVTVTNNLNFYKTPLCDSAACKRARKTELQRLRRRE
jgi:hypothetical protein